MCLRSQNRSVVFSLAVVQPQGRSVVQFKNRSVVQSFSRKIVQSFSRSTIYIYIVEMGYFAAHSTWQYMVLYGTRYYTGQGTMRCKVGNSARYNFYHVVKIVCKYMLKKCRNKKKYHKEAKKVHKRNKTKGKTDKTSKK